MLAALSVAYGPKWGNVKNIAEDYFNETRERLEELAKQALDGRPLIEVKEFLAAELDILKSHLFAAQVLVESEVEQAVNAAVEIFEKLVTPK